MNTLMQIMKNEKTLMTPGKAHQTAAALNSAPDDDCTYVVKYLPKVLAAFTPSANAYIAVYDADGHFGINL